ncbi:MAG: flagellar M-ring protein FliF [Treponema sp.]|jgi:flagellar M-ring protein FliF|nr:flagellar M-ring protein FliF [Treponema sp.]
MNEFLKKLLSRITSLWGRWSMLQRIILVGIVVVALGGVIALTKVSSAPTMASVFDAPVRDEAALDRILLRINEEGVKAVVSSAGIVQVSDERTARRMRSILIREDMVPSGMDPWAIFDRERWTITDFERNVNLQRAIRQMVTDHIKAIDGVDDANVSIVNPERELFLSSQNPVTASVIITPKPGSDITVNRKKIEGIQKILKFAVEGLLDDNIVITDQAGIILNDFSGMAAVDRINIIDKENKLIQALEAKYRAIILTALQKTFTEDRVRDLNIKIDMDMSKKAVDTEEFFPITIKPRTPGLPYDDSVLVHSVTRSESNSDTRWEGTGYNPEGPAGTEGQTPPAFKDMSNLYGRMTQETKTHNEEINRKTTQEERSPQIDRVTVSVNIDGRWKWKYDEKGRPVMLADGSIDREYSPIPPDQIRSTQLWIQNAVGYNAARGDSVTVQNIPFDRTRQFIDEDAAYFRKKQIQTTVLIFLLGLTILLVSFIIFRLISREMERRRRFAEDERARREQAIRESAIATAEEEGVDVSISVEERTRMELLESVVNMAKEHPEDCAQLIRTWLLEE